MSLKAKIYTTKINEKYNTVSIPPAIYLHVQVELASIGADQTGDEFIKAVLHDNQIVITSSMEAQLEILGALSRLIRKNH